ncbi:MAG: PAS domain-containing protein [Paracoccus sp. (in: a-proteobacteria)]|nr:PAS domain-containing protein [Paracoccus sp. (in: a-proteobacteria)]
MRIKGAGPMDGPESDTGDDTAGEVREGGVVVPLTGARGRDPGVICAELRACWDGLRKGRAVPERAEIDPRLLRGLLDHAFILERIAPGAARFRLAGRHLVDVMGMEVRGMPLCSVLNPSSRGRLSDVLETVFKAPQIAEFRLEAQGGFGRPPLAGHMVLLPLRSDLGDVTRALGALAVKGDIGRAPRRFDIARDVVFPIVAGGSTLAPSPSGFAEMPEPWRAPVLSQPRKPLPEDATPEERRARFRVVGDAPDQPQHPA